MAASASTEHSRIGTISQPPAWTSSYTPLPSLQMPHIILCCRFFYHRLQSRRGGSRNAFRDSPDAALRISIAPLISLRSCRLPAAR